MFGINSLNLIFVNINNSFSLFSSFILGAKHFESPIFCNRENGKGLIKKSVNFLKRDN